MIALKEDFVKLLEILVEQEVEDEGSFAAGYLAGQQHLAELILNTKGDMENIQ